MSFETFAVIVKENSQWEKSVTSNYEKEVEQEPVSPGLGDVDLSVNFQFDSRGLITQWTDPAVVSVWISPDVLAEKSEDNNW